MENKIKKCEEFKIGKISIYVVLFLSSIFLLINGVIYLILGHEWLISYQGALVAVYAIVEIIALSRIFFDYLKLRNLGYYIENGVFYLVRRKRTVETSKLIAIENVEITNITLYKIMGFSIVIIYRGLPEENKQISLFFSSEDALVFQAYMHEVLKEFHKVAIDDNELSLKSKYLPNKKIRSIASILILFSLMLLLIFGLMPDNGYNLIDIILIIIIALTILSVYSGILNFLLNVFKSKKNN